jgi:hypothetical protein
MNLYDRYLQRASGERRFQPADKVEGICYAVLDLLNEHRIDLPGQSDLEKSRFVNQLEEYVIRGLTSVR